MKRLWGRGSIRQHHHCPSRKIKDVHKKRAFLLSRTFFFSTQKVQLHLSGSLACILNWPHQEPASRWLGLQWSSSQEKAIFSSVVAIFVYDVLQPTKMAGKQNLPTSLIGHRISGELYLQFEKSTACLIKLHTWKCLDQLFLEQLFSTGFNYQLPVRNSPWGTANSSNWLKQSFSQTLLLTSTEELREKRNGQKAYRHFISCIHLHVSRKIT